MSNHERLEAGSRERDIKQVYAGDMAGAARIAYAIGVKDKSAFEKKRALRVKTVSLIAQNPSSGLGVEQTAQRRERFPYKNITFSLFDYWFEKGSIERGR